MIGRRFPLPVAFGWIHALVRFLWSRFSGQAGGTNAMGKLQEYWKIKDAAEYLGVVPNTLGNWGREGKIKERRNPLNGYRLYRKADLDRLLRRIEASTATKPAKR